MNTETKAQIAARARQHIKSQQHGVLATHSAAMPGYPFGSLMPYCLSSEGELVILMSRIAQHTRNIDHDNKSSLTIITPEEDIQASARVTYLGHVTPCEDQTSIERYYRHFPNAKSYHSQHDFELYQIKLGKIRFIGGFGDIHWIKKEDYLLDKVFSLEEEQSIIDHMNNDHANSLNHYCDQSHIKRHHQQARLISVDCEGMFIRVNQHTHYIPFLSTVGSTHEIRKVLIQMAS